MGRQVIPTRRHRFFCGGDHPGTPMVLLPEHIRVHYSRHHYRRVRREIKVQRHVSRSLLRNLRIRIGMREEAWLTCAALGYRILFSVLWALTTYFPFAHMVWGGGYFGELGLLDFAGGIVVHLTAGAAALMAAIMVSFLAMPLAPAREASLCSM